jgi:hypothetical protein
MAVYPLGAALGRAGNLNHFAGNDRYQHIVAIN